MEWFGLIAFILVLCMPSHDREIKNHETRLKRIENKNKGANVMSKLIKEMVGKDCVIKSTEAISFGDPTIQCHILDADDEWVKIRFTTKKGEKTKLMRISAIDEIELADKETV